MAIQTVQCKADNYVMFSSPNTNNSGLDHMLVNRPAGEGEMAFLQFDVPTLANKQITKAELKVYCISKGKRSIIRAAQWAIPVSVNTLTGRIVNNQYIDSDMSYSPTEHTSSVTVSSANVWVAWDITSIISNSLGTNDMVIGIVDAEENIAVTEWWRFASRESSNIPYIEITYNDAVPDIPTILYPNGDVIEKGNALTFRWKHNSIFDTGQTKYDFGWRQQGIASWTEALGVVTTVQSRTLDTSSMPTGIIEWRVRTYNANNAVSEYAYGAFELTGRPAAPIIESMKNDAITEITWRSNEAETAIFRIGIYQGATLIHDSGEMPGGLASSYIPNMMFPDGQYTVRMRIGSVYGVWSDEAAKVFTLSTSSPSIPDITLSATEGGILIESSSVVPDKIVYRSESGAPFVPIARFAGQTYTDYAVKSDTMYEYYIRAHSGGYADSVKRPMRIKYKGCMISEIRTPVNFIKLYKSDSDWYNRIKTSHENESELIRYEGRTYPVKESGIHRQSVFNTSFYLENKDSGRMETMYEVNGIYLFRNSEVCLCCEISSFSHENTLFNRGKRVEVTLNRVDYNMGVRFDV